MQTFFFMMAPVADKSFCFLDTNSNPWGLPPDIATAERVMRERLALLPPKSADFKARREGSVLKQSGFSFPPHGPNIVRQIF
jgi:hypothetical protein